MRAAAEIEPVALLVDSNRLTRRDDVVDDLRLVILADLLERLDGVLFRPDFADDRIVLVDNFAHLRFDLLEVFRREGLLAREVVIEAVIDHRANRDLRVGIEFLHGLREDVGGIMAEQFQPLLVARRHDGDFCVSFERAIEVIHFPVHLGGKGGLVQSG